MLNSIDQRNAIATINYVALKHNLNQVKWFAAHSHILAMVKSNAYGHGIREIALALSDADGYGVACLSEALIIRQAGIQKPILLMEGFFSKEEIQPIQDCDLSIVIHSWEQIACLKHLKLTKPLKIWLKVDTGMHRLGFSSEYIGDVITQLEAIPYLHKPFVIMSHFACADEVDHPLNAIQLTRFTKIVNEFPHHQFSLANSAGIISNPKSHFDWVRPGIMLYGISPMVGTIGQDYGLIPAMELKAQIIEKKIINKDEPVGYGAMWRSSAEMTMGIIGFGYGDGYPRGIMPDTPVLIRKKLCPIIGRVSMDLCAVDLTNCQEAQVGEKIILWGKNLPIEYIARKANTIAYELVTKLTRRVKFVYGGFKQ